MTEYIYIKITVMAFYFPYKLIFIYINIHIMLGKPSLY